MDPLSDEYFEARRADLATRVGERRFEHSVRVAETASELAALYDVDVRKARLAGILHDWDKCYDDPGIQQRVAELDLDIPDDIVANFPQTLHEKTAACALAREFPEVPQDVIQAIERHTTGAVDMSPLDMVLYVADGLEPGRQFDEAPEFRAMIGKATLEELFVGIFGFWIELVLRRHKKIHPHTITVWNAYVARERQRRQSDEVYVAKGVAGEESFRGNDGKRYGIEYSS